MSDLNARIWAGEKGYLTQAWGRYERSEKDAAALIAYLSAIYSIIGDAVARFRNRNDSLILRVVRLLGEMTEYLPELHLRVAQALNINPRDLTLDQAETLSAIFYRYSRWWFLGHCASWDRAEKIVRFALREADYENGGHTLALLRLTLLKMEIEENGGEIETEYLSRILFCVEEVAAKSDNPDQKSRVMRRMAEVYLMLELPPMAQYALAVASAIPGISHGTRQKNLAMFRRT